MSLTILDSASFDDNQDAIGTKVRAEILNILNNPMDLIHPLVLQNLGAPSTNGQISRNGTRVQYHDGTTARQLMYSADYVGIQDVGEPTVTNTVTTTATYLQSIAGGTLGTLNFIRGHVDYLITGIINNSTLTFVFNYGAQPFFTMVVNNTSGGTQLSVPVGMDFVIHGRGSVTAQIASAHGWIAPINGNLAVGVANNWSTANVTGLTVNSAVAQNLQLNVAWNTADPSNAVSGLGLVTWRI